jgi:hypothetical protein
VRADDRHRRIVRFRGAGVVAAAAVVAGSGLGGTYRSAITVPRLVRAGDGGTWTLTFAAGSWALTQSGGSLGNSFDRGTFVRRDGTLLLTLVSANGASHHVFLGVVRMRESAGRLRFTPVPPEVFDILGVLAAGTWRRGG